MPLTLTQPRKVGRPQAAAGTIRILPSGVIRLSPDLCTSERFDVLVNSKIKQLVFRPGKRYALRYSSPYARSGLLTVHPDTFFLLGVKPKDIAGEYAVVLLQRNEGFFVRLGEQKNEL